MGGEVACIVSGSENDAPSSRQSSYIIQMPQGLKSKKRKIQAQDNFGTISRRLHTQETRPEQTTRQENRGRVGDARTNNWEMNKTAHQKKVPACHQARQPEYNSQEL